MKTEVGDQTVHAKSQTTQAEFTILENGFYEVQTIQANCSGIKTSLETLKKLFGYFQ